MALLRFLERVERWLLPPLSALNILSCIALATMLVLITVEVLLRGLFGTSTEISEEVSTYALVALVFLGLPRLMLKDGLLKVDALYDRFSKRAQRCLTVIYSVIALAITYEYTFQIWRLVSSSFRRGTRSTTLLKVPQYIPQSIVLIGLGGLMLALLGVIAANLGALGRRAKTSNGPVKSSCVRGGNSIRPIWWRPASVMAHYLSRVVPNEDPLRRQIGLRPAQDSARARARSGLP